MSYSLQNDWMIYKDELFLVTIQFLFSILRAISTIILILMGFTGKHGQLEMEMITWLTLRKVSVEFNQV